MAASALGQQASRDAGSERSRRLKLHTPVGRFANVSSLELSEPS